MIAATAMAGCLCLGISIVVFDHIRFYEDAPYRLEGAMAFATHGPTNLLIMANFVESLCAIAIFGVYAFTRGPGKMTPHLLLAGLLLLPCVGFVGFFVLRFFRLI